MTTTKPVKKVKRQKVTLLFESAEADEVFVAGDFNKWNPKAHPLKKDGDCRWIRTLMIPPGKYEYKFFADGQWIEDPRNDRVCMNDFGTYNSVLDLYPK